MADLNKPLDNQQDAENTAPAADDEGTVSDAVTDAADIPADDAAADAQAEDADSLTGNTDSAEQDMDNALNEMDAFMNELQSDGGSETDTDTGDTDTPADADAAPSGDADTEPAPKKRRALTVASASENRISSEKKHKKKKGKREMTIEEDIADLEQEEKEFDEWGRRIRKKRKKKRKKTRKLSCVLVLLTLILALSSMLSVTILALAKEMYGIDKNTNERIINIPEGSTVTEIADQLVDEKMITLPQMFRLVSRMNDKDGSYIAGEHVLSASMSYEDMIEELCTNHVDERETVTVTFREGITLLEAAQKLQESDVCNAEKFLFYFNAGGYDFRFEEELPQTKNPLKFQQMEGYCFPDTYEFYVDEDPNIVAQKIYANFDSKLSDGDYKKMKELNMTLDEVITLASIVQGEAPNMAEMKKVSSVFHNRLNSPEFEKLQSDPTRKYAEDTIAPNLPLQNQLMCDAYNTYTSAGLPPGAINNPGVEAIQAVLYPDDTPYFYFNANIDTREVFYAITYEEHLANLAKVEQQYAAAAANGDG